MQNIKKLKNEYLKNKIDMTLFYNHDKFLKSASHGMRIIENTNFQKYEHARIEAVKKYKKNMIIKDNINQLYKILEVEHDNLKAIPMIYYTQHGKLKKNYNIKNINPCHVIEVIQE